MVGCTQHLLPIADTVWTSNTRHLIGMVLGISPLEGECPFSLLSTVVAEDMCRTSPGPILGPEALPVFRLTVSSFVFEFLVRLAYLSKSFPTYLFPYFSCLFI